MATPAPDFKVINMSTGPNKGGDAEARIDTISEILESERPTLAFVQEFTWADLHGEAFSKVDIPDQYKLFWNEQLRDPGFIYDVTAIDCQPLDQERVRSLYDESKQAFTTDAAELGRYPRMESYFFELDRLCLCKIKRRGSPEFELLCASWHGCYMGKDVNDQKIKLEKNEKKVILRSLFEFLLTIQVYFNDSSFMIGGDFNLESEMVKDVFKEFLISSPRDDSYMLWLMSEDLYETFDHLCHNWARHPAFDHFVLNMSFQRRTPGNNRQVPYWKVNDGNDSDNDDVSEYGLVIRPTELQMMTATWHGADASDSDEEKEQSLREALGFLLGKIYKIPKKIQGKYDLAWVLKDRKETSTDTWILSNDKSSLLGIKRDGERLEAIAENLLPMEQRIALPHNTNIHLDMENVRLPCTDGYTISGSLKLKPSINVEQEGNTEGKEEGKEELCKNFHKMAISK